MAQRYEVLGESEISAIVSALNYWGRSTSVAEEPVLSMLDGTQITPLDISLAMEDPHSRVRDHILNLVAVGLLNGDKLEDILADFTAEEEFGDNERPSSDPEQ